MNIFEQIENFTRSYNKPFSVNTVMQYIDFPDENDKDLVTAFLNDLLNLGKIRLLAGSQTETFFVKKRQITPPKVIKKRPRRAERESIDDLMVGYK